MATSRGPLHNFDVVEKITLGQKWLAPGVKSFTLKYIGKLFKILFSETTWPRVYIWYMATSRCPIHIFWKKSAWGQNWPRPRG